MPPRIIATFERDAEIGRDVLARIGVPVPRSGEALRFTRLAGLTNRVYRIDAPAGRFCLRIPGAGTAAIIDRAAEERNARAAARAEVAPPVLYFGADGVMLTPFLDAEALSPERLRADAGALSRAALALRRLHDAAPAFANEFRAFAVIERYGALLDTRDSPDAALLAEAAAAAAEVRLALAARPVPLAPCHCDPTGANLLDTGEEVWLIDWEYSGMNDPMWDLAYLSLQAGLDRTGDERLLRAYSGGDAPSGQLARMALQKLACELLSAAWALVQDSAGNPVADFRSYAEATLATILGRLRSPEFRQVLDAFRRA